MDLAERFRLGLVERGDPPGLRAGLILRHHPSGGQNQRESVVGLLGGVAMLDPVEPRAAGLGVGSGRGTGVRVPAMALVGAGPEHAVLGQDAVPGDALVVGHAAGAGPAQLLENWPAAPR